MSQRWTTRAQRGVTLIEATIGLLVISLLVFPMIKLVETGEQKRKIADSDNRVNEVSEAIKRYWMDYGRFPRPASVMSRPGDATFGRQASGDDIKKWYVWDSSSQKGKVTPGVFNAPGNIDALAARDMTGGKPVDTVTIQDTTQTWEVNQWQGSFVTLSSCSGGTGIPSYPLQIISNTTDTLTVPTLTPLYTTAPTSACKYKITRGVMIGSIPFADLGLSADQALDPYGRRLTYMVTAHLTGTFGNTSTTASTDLASGAIGLMNQLFGRGGYWQQAYTLTGTSVCRSNVDSTNFKNCCSYSPASSPLSSATGNDVCLPSKYTATGLSSSSNIIFAVIDHGKDGRGAFTQNPPLRTAGDESITADLSGASASDPVSAAPFNACSAHASAYGAGPTYYTHSIPTGLELDNCDHLLMDAPYNTTMYGLDGNRYLGSTIRIIQEEIKNGALYDLQAIAGHRFSLKTGPFYYDDIVGYRTGVDASGWVERSDGAGGGAVIQTSNKTTSGWTALGTPEVGPDTSISVRFPVQVGLLPYDPNYGMAFNDSSLTDDANLKAAALHTDMICSYTGYSGYSSGPPWNKLHGFIKVDISSATGGGYTKFTAGTNLGGGSEKACFSVGRFASDEPYTSTFGVGMADADGSTYESRRSSLLCETENSPIRGFGYYVGYGRDVLGASNSFYFNQSGTNGELFESFLGNSSYPEPFLAYDPLSEYGCGHTKTRIPSSKVSVGGGCGKSTGVSYGASGAMTLTCD